MLYSTIMKRIKPLAIFAVLVILLAYNVQAQPKNIYPKEWQHIDSLVARALPKSALAEVKKIYVAAKKNSQDAQLIKCLVYMTSLQQETRENNEQLATKELENEIATSKEPAASILKSLLANVYLQYFERNRWMLYQRTNTTNFNKEDIATWTPNDFHNKISNLYLQSIHNKTLLKATNLNAYNAIIIRGNVRHLRPTLYDLLAQQALNYFKSDEGDIRKPAYSFEISQPEAFAPAADFAKASFTTKDSLSLLHKALLIFQDLIAFHVSDAKPDALIDVDINRIQFVYEHSVSLNKEALYQQALKNIINTYNSPSLTSQASFLLASYYESLAARYQPLQDTAHRYDRIKAKEILEKTVRDSTVKNEGWVNSFNLLQDINRTNFSFEIEKVNIPGQPFRALVNYKNTPALFFRIIKINAALKASLLNHYDENIGQRLQQRQF